MGHVIFSIIVTLIVCRIISWAGMEMVLMVCSLYARSGLTGLFLLTQKSGRWEWGILNRWNAFFRKPTGRRLPWGDTRKIRFGTIINTSGMTPLYMRMDPSK